MNRSLLSVVNLLTGIGALILGLFVFNINLIAMIFSSIPVLASIIYAIIGISGLLTLAKMAGIKV